MKATISKENIHILVESQYVNIDKALKGMYLDFFNKGTRIFTVPNRYCFKFLIKEILIKVAHLDGNNGCDEHISELAYNCYKCRKLLLDNEEFWDDSIPYNEDIINRPALSGKRLWEHQIEAIKDLCSGKKLQLLSTGVGKTPIAIKYAELLHNAINNCATIVIASPTILPAWEDKIKDWWPDSDILYSNGGASNEKFFNALLAALKNENIGKHLFILMSYGTFQKDNLLQGIPVQLMQSINLCILDESHKIKSSDTNRHRNIKALPYNKILLTGTFISKDYVEGFNQARSAYVMPYDVINSEVFHMRYAIPDGRRYYYSSKIKEKLNAKTAEMATVLRKEDVLSLPEIVEEDIKLELKGEYFQLYDDLTKMYYSKLETVDKEQVAIYAMHILSVMRKQQQICGGFVDATILNTDKPVEINLFKDEEAKININLIEKYGSEKFDATIDIVDGADGKTVIFAQHIKEIQYLNNYINEVLNIKCGTLYGTTPIEERYDIWHNQFLIGDMKVLITQPKTGGEGIDLYSAENIIFYTESFSFIEKTQAINRVHRPGQNNRVTIFYPYYKNTIEAYIRSVLNENQSLHDYVMNAVKEGGRIF